MTFQIIVPGRFIEARDAVDMRLGMEGWFTLEAIRNGRTVRKHSFRDSEGRAGPFKNLILNNGLDKFATDNRSNLIRYFRAGTGTAAPDVTQTQLVNQIGGNVAGTADQTIPGEPPDYVSRMVVGALSSIGHFGNNNLTEIGIGGNGSADLFSRSLIVDSEGNPTAFPISSEEQLRMSYEIRLFPPLEDAFFTVNVAGQREVIVRALGVTSSSYWAIPSPSASSGGVAAEPQASNGFRTGDLNDITATSSQGSSISGSSTTTVHPYSPGSYKRSHRQSFSSTQAVSDSIRSHQIRYGCCAFQVQYDPPLQKTDEQTMYLEYELSWGRR